MAFDHFFSPYGSIQYRYKFLLKPFIKYRWMKTRKNWQKKCSLQWDQENSGSAQSWNTKLSNRKERKQNVTSFKEMKQIQQKSYSTMNICMYSI